MKKSIDEALRQERFKLSLLIEEAFAAGIPVLQDKAIQEQSRRVDRLMERVQKQREREG